MPPPRRVAADADELDHAVAFLKTRDGLDKSLKLLRYAAMLGAFGADPRGVAGSKLRHLDRSTATARKFLRLGKFLGNARDLRSHWRARERLIEKTQRSGAVAAKVRRIEETETRAFDAHTHALRLNRLNIGCSGASLAYYFLEQFVWAKAVGLIRGTKTNTRVARLANLAELCVYVFSLQMCWGELRDARAAFDRAEKALLDARKRDDEDAALSEKNKPLVDACLKKEGGAGLVGWRVRVFWKAENAWFYGTVKAFDAASGKHAVSYDDGDEQTLALKGGGATLGFLRAPRKANGARKSAAEFAAKALGTFWTLFFAASVVADLDLARMSDTFDFLGCTVTLDASGGAQYGAVLLLPYDARYPQSAPLGVLA